MNAPRNTHDQPVIITFSDLWNLLKKNKRKIYFSACACSLLIGAYGITRPLSYHADATFRDKGATEAGINALTPKNFFSGGNDTQSEAATLMQSRRLMETVVNKLGLNVTIRAPGERVGLWTRAWRNLKAQKAIWREATEPLFVDAVPELHASGVMYSGEVPVELKILFVTNDNFEVERHGEKVGQGTIGHPFVHEDMHITLNKREDFSPESKEYLVYIQPVALCAEGLCKRVTVSVDKKDASLLKLSYDCFDRRQSSQVLNTLMSQYKNYVIADRDRWAKAQLAYLHRRQGEAGDQLKTIMEEHAKSLSGQMMLGGMDIDREIAFLSQQQQLTKQRLLQIDLQLKRLSIVNEDFEKAIILGTQEAGTVSQRMSGEIYELRRQRDELALALQLGLPPAGSDQLRAHVSQQWSDFERIQGIHDRLEEIAIAIESGKQIPKREGKQESIDVLAQLWQAKLQELDKNSAKQNDQETPYKEQCLTYLYNLIHQYDVYAALVKERLTHPYNPHEEFVGMDLSTARVLYGQCCSQLSELQKEIKQTDFVLVQFDNPDFEMSSLSGLLSDPVSNDIAKRSSDYSISLKDENNRSQKEQERIRETMVLQRKFLEAHLTQLKALEELEISILHDKVQALQAMMVELINQRLSVMEKQFVDYAEGQVQQLQDERDLVVAQMQEMQEAMAALPSKWMTNQMINHTMSINRDMVTEISRLVESKNLTKNLELIQSSAMDVAIAPILPSSPRLPLFFGLGAVLGVVLMSGGVLVRGVVRGVIASKENLSLMGESVAGAISWQCGRKVLRDEDLETCRRLLLQLTEGDLQRKHVTLLALLGNGPDYTRHIADLLVKGGNRVLYVSLEAQYATSETEKGTLWQYLEGKIATPYIEKGSYDTLIGGILSRFAAEKMQTQPFTDFLEKLRQEYDWVIVVSHARAEDAYAEQISGLFTDVAISVTDQRLEELQFYMQNATLNISYLIVN